MKLTPSLHYICASALVVLSAGAFATGAFAQNAPHFNSLVIDAGGGNTLTLQPPTTGWTGNLNYELPMPPSIPAQAGFVEVGSSDGQILTWDNTNSLWAPSGSPAVTGTGTDGYIPEWSSGSLTNSNIQDLGAGDALVINQNVIINGTLNVSSDLTVGGTTTLNGSLIANSDATFNNTVTFNGPVTLSGTGSVTNSGPTTLNGSLNVAVQEYSAGATITINTASQTVAVITDDGGTAANAISLDAGTTAGQMLTIINDDGDVAAYGLYSIPVRTSRTFVWDGLGWR